MILAATLMRATKHKEFSSPGPGPELCLRVWSQRVSCLAFTMPAPLLLCKLLLCCPTQGAADLLSFPKKDHPQSGTSRCLGGNLPLSLGFRRAIFQFAQQTYVPIQRSFKPTERLLLIPTGFSSRCPGEQGTVGPKIGSHRWHSSHPPPAPPGHSSVATGRCLHHCPIDTGQSSRKPSKS